MISTMAAEPWGGSEALWPEMAAAALRQGHQVAVSVFRWPTVPPPVQELGRAGALVHRRRRPRFPTPDRILTRVFGRPVRLPRPRGLPWLSSFEEIRRFAPDVVCVNQGTTYDALGHDDLLAWLYGSGLPYVVVCHSNDELPIERIFQVGARDLFARAARVCFVAERNRRAAERQIAASIGNACVVRNPVNLADASAVAWPGPGPVRLASVARFDARHKAQDVLFETLAAPGWRERDWRLSLFGRGGDEAYLRELAGHFGIAERVEFRGHVADIRAVWRDHHLLVLPSRLEGTPISLVEAMLCARPAVATDVGGIAEWLSEPDTGFLGAAPSAASFGAALERAWEARSEWPAIGERARAAALLRHDPRPGESLLRLVLDAAAPGRTTP